MRELKIGTTRYTKVFATDEPGQGGACHQYCIIQKDSLLVSSAGGFGHVVFQNGPVKEFGVNGCHQEDLLAIVIDRLESFQAGLYKCRENALAITKIQEAMHWLNHRTKEREIRGVEGTNVL